MGDIYELLLILLAIAVPLLFAYALLELQAWLSRRKQAKRHCDLHSGDRWPGGGNKP